MTTRKPPRVILAATTLVLLAGCATPGPLHVYSLPSTKPTAIVDHRPEETQEVPSFTADERITGFAYDPFTDHFFIRLAPGNHIRVVDRPAQAIKRDFELDAVATGEGDMAVKPQTGHVFLLCGDATVVEVTRLGRLVRTFTLAETTTMPVGLAYDAQADLLLVAHRGFPSRITVHDLAGTRRRVIPLDREIDGPLGYDSVAREFFAPLANRTGVGVFDENGRLLRTMEITANFIDVGPRSFIRVF